MKYLLDTHVLLWFFLGNRSLGLQTLQLLQSSQNEIVLSVINFTEIEIKLSSGKLKHARDIQQTISKLGLSILPLNAEHVLYLRDLPLIHRDPFDRLLVAQAIRENFTLVTSDSNILQYPNVKLFDAKE